jgi:hypothetical protein
MRGRRRGRTRKAPQGLSARLRATEVRVPGFLRPIHGETALLLDVLLVYAVGAVFGILALVFAYSRVETLPAWKSVVLFLVASDAGGGVVAGFSASTGRYHASHPGVKRAFIILHFVEPGVLWLTFGGKIAYWVFLYGFTVAAAFLVTIIRDTSRQQAAAAAFVVLGTVILLPIALATPFLAWFWPIYMLELILGFAVHRPG